MAIAFVVTRPSPPATVVFDIGSVTPEMSIIDVKVAGELPTSRQAPYMTNAIPVRMRRNSSTIPRLHKKRHRNATTEPAASVVKKENVLNGAEASNTSHQSSETVATQEALLGAVKTVSCVYTKRSPTLHETRELQDGEGFGESVDLLQCDTPCNVRLLQSLQNCNHNGVNAKDMEAFRDFS